MTQIFRIFVVLLLGVIVLFALMAMTLTIRFSPLWSQEAAGWIQAIGSVVAIIAAFFLGERQAAKARTDAIDLIRFELANKRQAILEICRAAKLRSDLVRSVFITNFQPVGRYEIYDHALIKGVIAGLDTAPVYEIGNADAINAFLEIKVQCNLLIDAIDALEKEDDVRLLTIYPNTGSAKIGGRQRNIAVHCNRIDLLYNMIVENIFKVRAAP